MDEDKDAVSAMQESVDQLALSMFDSLRLIPFSEVKGVVPQQGAESVVIRRAVATGTAWHNQVQALAEGVLTQARNLDGLIDVLPGAELREDQQMEEIKRLDEEGRRHRVELAKMVERAEKLSQGVNGNLDQLADHMLSAPR